MSHDLILIRHSLTQVDPGSPSHTWSLSAEGRRRCILLADRLRPHHPSRLITSTELKAQETGQIIAEQLDLPVTAVPGLEEHKRSQAGFLDAAAFKHQIARLLTEPETLVFGEETGQQARERFTQTLDQLLKQYPNDTLALVSHGTILTLFVSAFNKVAPISFWEGLNLPDFLLIDRASYRLKFPE